MSTVFSVALRGRFCDSAPDGRQTPQVLPTFSRTSQTVHIIYLLAPKEKISATGPMNTRTFLKAVVAVIAASAASLAGETIVYKTVNNRPLKLLVEKPADWKASDARPAIVFLFGGGWVGGSPEQFLKQSEYLASRGMVGIRVEYRTIPKGDSGPPLVCCADAKSAIRYVRAHAAELGIDPARIAGAGGSAGGHLAAFTAMVDGSDDPHDDLKVSCKPDALVLFNPVFNNGPGEWGHERVKERFKEFSPAHNINKSAPPTIVFLGDTDKLIPVKVLDTKRK
jgi:acetyl esterase